MDKMIPVVIAGRERLLNYSIEVMFDVNEKFGSVNTLLDLMQQNTRDGFEATKWLVLRMANDGELCRRAEGYDAVPMLTNDDIPTRIRPIDFAELVAAATDAVRLGYQRENQDEDQEIDIGLEELNAKK